MLSIAEELCLYKREVIETLSQYNQMHLLKFYEELNNVEKMEFLSQLRSLSFDEMDKSFKAAVNIIYEEIEENLLEPVALSEFGSELTCGEDMLEYYMRKGLTSMSNGQIGALVLSGGQGTRLGFPYPKGMFSIGLPSGKTLFQVQAERLLRLQFLAERQTGVKGTIPWYVMTSGATHDDIDNYLKTNSYFGLKESQVILFKQQMQPCFTFDGKIIMDTKSSLALAPNGTGGVFKALEGNGLFEDMDRRGVKYIHIYSVDNILVKVADPVFMGYCMDKCADCAAKVVRKVDPLENLGVVCRINGRYNVVEYTEVPHSLASKRDASGNLLFCSGSICIHFFAVDFMREIAKKDLKVHVAKKKIPFVDETGQTRSPHDVNGIKIERLVFDAFPYAENFVTWEVSRETEFSALKNPDDFGVECPRTALSDLFQLHKRYVERAGGQVEGNVEISPLVSYAGEDLEEIVGGKLFENLDVIHLQSAIEYKAKI